MYIERNKNEYYNVSQYLKNLIYYDFFQLTYEDFTDRIYRIKLSNIGKNKSFLEAGKRFFVSEDENSYKFEIPLGPVSIKFNIGIKMPGTVAVYTFDGKNSNAVALTEEEIKKLLSISEEDLFRIKQKVHGFIYRYIESKPLEEDFKLALFGYHVTQSRLSKDCICDEETGCVTNQQWPLILEAAFIAIKRFGMNVRDTEEPVAMLKDILGKEENFALMEAYFFSRIIWRMVRERKESCKNSFLLSSLDFFVYFKKGSEEMRQLFSFLKDSYSQTDHIVLNSQISEFTEESIRKVEGKYKNLVVTMWCILKGKSYKDSVTRALNLNVNPSVVVPLVGTLAALQFENIPEDWILNFSARKELKKNYQKIEKYLKT